MGLMMKKVCIFGLRGEKSGLSSLGEYVKLVSYGALCLGRLVRSASPPDQLSS